MSDATRGAWMTHRDAAPSAGKGARFAQNCRTFFEKKENLKLSLQFRLDVRKKPHKFDLGCDRPPALVECKNHKWTRAGNLPSGKLAFWNEAMLYFINTPIKFRKILAVRDTREGAEKRSLAMRYLARFGHLVPKSVEIWEIRLDGRGGRRVFPN